MQNKMLKKIKFLTGFTLFEVLLVVVIVVIIASLAIPRFRSTLTTVQLSDTTQDIAQLMRLLRVKAKSENAVYQLTFDFTKKQYTASKSAGKTATLYGQARVLPENVSVVVSVNPVKFYADGTVDKAVIYLFRGSDKFGQDMQSAINKDIDLGQIQTVTQTAHVYSITTQPSLGRIKVSIPS